MEEYAREPCPYRIVDDCGGAFAMGCIGGSVFQAIKGTLSATDYIGYCHPITSIFKYFFPLNFANAIKNRFPKCTNRLQSTNGKLNRCQLECFSNDFDTTTTYTEKHRFNFVLFGLTDGQFSSNQTTLADYCR